MDPESIKNWEDLYIQIREKLIKDLIMAHENMPFKFETPDLPGYVAMFLPKDATVYDFTPREEKLIEKKED